MKKIYLVQHGTAHSKDVDEKRPLTDSGIKDTRKIAEYLKKNEVVISKIYHSGKLRASQTAEIFSEIMAVNNISALPGMNPNDKPEELIRQMNEDNVMYIGHLPNLQKVVSKIIAHDESIDVIKFQNSAAVCVESEDDTSRIKWFITPAIC